MPPLALVATGIPAGTTGPGTSRAFFIAPLSFSLKSMCGPTHASFLLRLRPNVLIAAHGGVTLAVPAVLGVAWGH